MGSYPATPFIPRAQLRAVRLTQTGANAISISALFCCLECNTILYGERAMDFTALRYFSETAHSRSIRAASERLHVSPSAISRQIAKLEHELHAPIFDRRAHGMTLTAAGEILQSKVEEMMREFARVTSHIAALQNLQSGTVDVYCF